MSNNLFCGWIYCKIFCYLHILNTAVAGPPLAESETGAPAEDSDYFTPEDTHTTILSSPNQQANIKNVITSAW